MTRERMNWAMFGVAAIALAVSAVAIPELPRACGQVGRPNLDLFARATLAIGGAFWIAGLATASRRRKIPSARSLLAVAALELGVGIGLALYYQHQVGWYGHCG